MNKRNKIIIAGATTLVAAGLMLAVVANGVGNFLGTYAEGTIYTLTLNSSNGGSGFSSSYSSSEQTNTAARTTQGNKIDFNYKNAKQSSGNYVDLAAGGYFYNTTKLTGLESVKVIYSGAEDALDIATSSTTTFSDGATLSTDTHYDIDVNMDYFRIRNISGSAVQISSVIVKYACATRVAYYTKVESASDFTDGKYLIVCESKNVVLDGSLSSSNIDSTSNNKAVTIESSKIASNATIDSYAFTISASAGTIKSNSGYYLDDASASSNGIGLWETAYQNSISFNANGDAIIEGSDGPTLRCNTSNSNRFRYFTSASTGAAVQLYKKGGSGGGDTPTPTPTPEETTYQQVTDGINAGDKVVIVAQENRTSTSGYAMTSTIINNYYFSKADASISDSKLTLTDDMELWTVGGSAGAYTFYSETKEQYFYAYTTTSGTKTYRDLGLTSSLVEGSAWAVTANEAGTGYDMHTSHNSNELYLEYYSSKSNFSAYSASATDYVLNFYREVVPSSDPVAVEGVSLNKSSLSLIQDASETLIATVTPNNATDKSVTWTSSEPGVASVDSTGKVTALAAGSTTITVKTTDGEFTATCTVLVTAKVPVTSVSVSPTSKTLNKGETVTLTATVSPSTATNKNVTWSSNNTSIATVDSTGKVTALAAGTATITVTTADGGKTATSTITVNPTPVSGVSLDQSAISLKVGASQTLVATVTPEEADNKEVTWTSSNTSIATVDSTGKVTAVSEGSATVTATSKDDSSKSAQCAVTVLASIGYDLVTDASTLEAGDKLVIANSANSVAAGSLSSQVLSSVSASISDDTLELSDDMTVFTLGGSEGNWTLADSDGQLLGATAVKKLAWDSGTTTWSISISGGSATIQNGTESYGRFLCNTSTPRFTTYTSSTSSSMLLPELYRESSNVRSVSLDASDIGVNVGQTHTLTATVSPATALNKNVSWSSSDSTVASVTNEGVVTGVKAGTTTITVTTEDGSKTASCLVRVQSGSTIVPSNISLNKTSAEIEINGSVQLEATIKPENAANKNVTWSSSNTSVATVDSTGKVTGVAASSSAVTITAKTSNNLTATCSVTVTEEQIDAWTVMIYMCGSNLESGSDWSTSTPTINTNPSKADGYASQDLDEILAASGQRDDINIIVQTGGASVWQSGHAYSISNTQSERYYVKNQALVKDSTSSSIGQLNTGASSTFAGFMKWGLESYKAQKTAVILWDHGGAMYGSGMDEFNDGDSLTNSEVKSALNSAFSATNRTEKLEWIGYDECLMAVQDIAEFNSHYFNYMVASQESEYAGGWQYDEWLDDLYALKDTTVILKEIVDTFITSMGGASQTDSDSNQTLAYYDLSYMEEYFEAWESMSASLINNIDSKANFKNFVLSCKYFADSDYDYFGTFDVKDFLNKLKNNSTYYSGLSNKVSAVETAFSKLVKYSVAQKGAGNANGLCLVYSNSSSYRMGSYYSTSETNFTNWRSIVSQYGYL